MVRPRKRCACRLGCDGRLYKPSGIQACRLEVVVLFSEEMEAFHLCDFEGLTQAQAGESLGVSRGTVQRLLASARRKVSGAIADRKAIHIAASRSEALKGGKDKSREGGHTCGE
jgi:uncharacterized protein